MIQEPPAGLTKQADDAEDEAKSLRYAWYVVAVLTLVYVFSFIDRQIFSLLVGRCVESLAGSHSQGKDIHDVPPRCFASKN